LNQEILLTKQFSGKTRCCKNNWTTEKNKKRDVAKTTEELQKISKCRVPRFV